MLRVAIDDGVDLPVKFCQALHDIACLVNVIAYRKTLFAFILKRDDYLIVIGNVGIGAVVESDVADIFLIDALLVDDEKVCIKHQRQLLSGIGERRNTEYFNWFAILLDDLVYIFFFGIPIGLQFFFRAFVVC